MSTQARLDAYLAAEAKILAGQSVRFGERQLQRADLAEVRKAITGLQSQLAREQGATAGRGSLTAATVNFGGNSNGSDW